MLGELRKQRAQQQVVCEMIDREGRLETIFRTLIDVGELRAGVEDKRVNAGSRGRNEWPHGGGGQTWRSLAFA